MHTPDRKLGHLEKFQISKQLVKCYGSVNLTVDLHHSPRPIHDDKSSARQFYIDKLSPALAQLIQDHPLLSVATKDSYKPSAHFIRLESVNLEEIILFEESRFWEERDQIIANESRYEFDLDAESPLWHLLVCAHPDRPDQCSITLTVQHLIADGGSLVIFWKGLLAYLSNPPSHTGFASNIVTIISSEPLPSPMDQRHPPELDFVDMCQVVYGETVKILPKSLKNFLDPSQLSWGGDYPAPADAVHNTVLRTLKCGGPTWQSIVKKSKEHGVTVHATLYATAVLAWSELYPNTSLKTFTPTNCRFLCKDTPSDEIGNFVGTFENFLTVGELGIGVWPLAKSYHKILQANKINSAKKAWLLKYLKNFPEDYYEFYRKRRDIYEMGRVGGIELSDLGRADVLPSGGDWKVDGMWFCQSAHTSSNALGLNTITFDGTAHATIAWQAGSLDESKIDRMSQVWLTHLENCAI
ncbi:alcohol acetyltransferase [Phycomyces blakesleeanus]|uniref:Condensation domain-containing protein n=2 Tax=Phycomyces blakesleeanus TaxID=4837 RepID=A0A162XXN8_PHYB8|nr:hypothetical protein PHYBLDRAFT_180349 [Phycomyces blakesleeanus NRRL 1555(-)]OAD77165.1 hypothetical protein PHYBLDRAFT_180349 [Phycomyces blakesleeanus NRRL 1555(-)]|eukprot:XP_018295205.1 hypothetical protein PHYBLDRAFT_180349 [Phycomyces blakesleeanus NRRL 1555(-)]